MEKTIDGMAKDLFCDFITIAIHSLLYNRKVYPHGVFKLRQKFNIPVQVCYHPDVFDYVTRLVEEVGMILKDQHLHALHMVIGSDADGWEQLTFKLHTFARLTNQDQLNLLENQFKMCLLKLSVIESYLPLREESENKDVTWRIEIDAGEESMRASTGWVKDDQPPAAKDKSHQKNLISMKNVSTDFFNLEMLAYSAVN